MAATSTTKSLNSCPCPVNYLFINDTIFIVLFEKRPTAATRKFSSKELIDCRKQRNNRFLFIRIPVFTCKGLSVSALRVTSYTSFGNTFSIRRQVQFCGICVRIIWVFWFIDFICHIFFFLSTSFLRKISIV
jgi:hypothetical protein